MIYHAEPTQMRQPCKKCGGTFGKITTKGQQDCVYCDCGAFCYNAPKTETGRKVRSVSTVHEAITTKKRWRIIERANGRCEVCGKRKDINVGHILSVDVGVKMGMTDLEINSDENLAAMCSECNLGLGKHPIPARMLVALIVARTSQRVSDEPEVELDSDLAEGTTPVADVEAGAAPW
jgi:hypothetical protein